MRAIDLARSYEIPKSYEVLKKLADNEILLDVGSGHSIFPAFVAVSNPQLKVIASDIFTREWKYLFNYQAKIAKRVSHLFDVRHADATKLCEDLPELGGKGECSNSISTLEHLAYEGDIQVMRQISRLLKKDGICLLSVPLADRFKEEGSKGFFERTYDIHSLWERLISPSELSVVEISYFGPKNLIGRLYHKLYMTTRIFRALRIAIFQLFPILYGEVPRSRGTGVFLILKKS